MGVLGRVIGQASNVGPVVVHRIELAVPVAIAQESDPLTRGRPRGDLVLGWMLGEAGQPGAIGTDHVIVAPALANRARMECDPAAVW